MSRVLPADPSTLRRAVERLRAGGLVAFPTETVYGLGAAARDPQAVAGLFGAKGRPRHHPIIVHLGGAGDVDAWAASVPDDAVRLGRAFWPGPLTLVLQRAAGVPDAVTGGQETVALRVPSHPLAQRLLAAFGDGLAAPSANRFGRISPTTAEHVAEEFADLDLWVLDGGACAVGLESTIVDLSTDVPRLLRPGGIAVADLEAVLGRRLPPAGAPGGRGAQAGGAAPPRAPGGLPSHYAPRTPALWLEPAALDARARAEPRAAVLSRRPPPGGRAGPWRRLPADAVGYGRALYAALRELDAAGAPCILVEAVPATPAWLAVADRLRRATHGGGSDQRPANAPGAVAVADATP